MAAYRKSLEEYLLEQAQWDHWMWHKERAWEGLYRVCEILGLDERPPEMKEWVHGKKKRTKDEGSDQRAAAPTVHSEWE